jgi:RNA ligase (TIGR02306 family)
VVFFPVDSEFPQGLASFMGIDKILAGGKRVKTIKLRGEVSQGFVATVASVRAFLKNAGKEFNPETLTEDLGIIKYEPPVYMANNAYLKPLPGLVSVYDIEGCDNFPHIVDMLMDKIVYITEKAEGSHFAINLEGDDVTICQRRFSVHPKDGEEPHTFIKTASEGGYIDIAKSVRDLLGKTHKITKSFTMRGEILGPGVQGNYYGLPKHEVRIFEFEIDGKPVDSDLFWNVVKILGIQDKTVHLLAGPVTLKAWLGGKTVQEMSNGKSFFTDKLREGIVIKPEHEEHVPEFGRFFIKMRSPEYLAKTEN